MTPWVKLPHSFWRQPRMRRCGVEGYALAAAALTYSADNQTDGLLSADDLDAIAHSIGLGHPTQIAERLVTEGVWQLQLDGWRIPFEDQMRAERREQLHRHRAEAGRRGGQTRAKQAVRLPGGTFGAAAQVRPGKPGKHQAEEDEEVEVTIGTTTSSRQRRRDPVYDALARVQGLDLSRPIPRAMGSSLGAARRDLLEVEPDVTATEVMRRAGRYRRAWPKASLTAHALVKHWRYFDTDQDTPSDGRQPVNQR